jgi:hypothetical protein
MIKNASTTLCAASIVAYQLGLLPLFSSLFIDNKNVWPAIYWGFLGLNVAFATVVWIQYRSIRLQTAPTLIVCVIAIAISLIHGLDSIEKNFIITIAFFTWTLILSLASDTKRLLGFSASVTFLTAVICLCDIIFDDGFTNTIGRAAGLGINPNISAATILLGACASFWVIPSRLKSYFLAIIVAAIFVTLSKSTLLTAFCILVGIFGLTKLSKFKHTNRNPLLTERSSFRFLLVSALICVWIVSALFSNDRFLVAATDSYQSIRTAYSAFETAKAYVLKPSEAPKRIQAERQLAFQEQLDDQIKNAGLGTSATTQLTLREKLDDQNQDLYRNPIKSEGAQTDTQLALRERLDDTIKNEGMINSISARGLLLKRAWLTYIKGPWTGQGLNVAHDLIPHNTFLLFAIAFGHLGWLIPLALIWLCAYRVRLLLQLPLVFAVIGTMMFSHDVLLTPALILPVSLGIASFIGLRNPITVDSAAPIRWVAATTVGCFVVGSVFVNLTAAPISSTINNRILFEDGGNAYATTIPRPEFSGIMRLADARINEDGASLGPKVQNEEDVINGGHGRYYQRLRSLVFSASDNSDPRKSSKTYTIYASVSLHPLAILVFFALLIWAIRVWFTLSGRTPVDPSPSPSFTVPQKY